MVYWNVLTMPQWNSIYVGEDIVSLMKKELLESDNLHADETTY